MDMPIGRVHLDGHLLVFGYLLDMPHPLKITADGFLVDAILVSKLTQRLLALNIVRYYLGFIAANTAVKTASAVLT